MDRNAAMNGARLSQVPRFKGDRSECYPVLDRNRPMESDLRKLVGITSIICAILMLALASAEEITSKFTFDYAGKTRTYFSYMPDGGGPLPLVLLLHGSGRNGEIMVNAWKKLASKEQFIVAAPDAHDSSNWDLNSDPIGFFHAVIERVKAKHAIDEHRIYLFGHSAGACFTLFLAVLDSNYFAAAALHAGALTPQNYTLFDYIDQRMPIAIWVGDHDSFFPMDIVLATKKEFEAHGFHIELSVMPQHDHNCYDVSDRVNGEAWAFLKKAQLKQAEVAEQH